ncbi:hypothetical protein N7507_002034 [Penicillium longicatenatum]|nr:hypothetical protein N7507_002034 [Penicillium longicatenatum]
MSLSSPNPVTTPQQPSFRCDFPGCSLSYRRKEHLTRHAKSHYKNQSYRCPFCGRVCARNDTLRQHVRTHHKNKELQSSRAVQACNYCRSRRSRCNGKSPCDTCVERGISCSYTSNPRRQELQQTDSHDSSSTPMDTESPSLVSFSCMQPSSLQSAEMMEKSSCTIAPYVKAYFEKFHPKWPFLHPATFDPDREPAFLLQSVVMLGLWVTGDDNSRKAAKDLHLKLTSTFYEQREKWNMSNSQHERSQQQTETPSSKSISWPMATYQGILLQLIFALFLSHSTLDLGLTHSLPINTSRLLIALVHTCLKQNMFYYPSMLAQFNPETDPEVLIWLGIEEIKRFCLSLYRVCRQSHIAGPDIQQDASVLNTRRGPHRLGESLLSLTDLQFALPNSDELWHATSGLAARVTENSAAYHNENIEGNWISQTARLLQPCDAQFLWL